MKKKIVWLLVSCLMVAALVLGSCAPAVTEEEKEEAVTEEEKEEVVTEGKEMVTNSVGKLVEKPRYGGRLNHLCYNPTIAGFDEGFATQMVCHTVHFTHEELLTGDWTKGPMGTGEMDWANSMWPGTENTVPLLAESWEVTGPDTITWHIRKGVYWQDKYPVNGREMDAY
ncbi:hypothetical protein ACFLUF_03510, partial [Chloroflexota bacterium]